MALEQAVKHSIQKADTGRENWVSGQAAKVQRKPCLKKQKQKKKEEPYDLSLEMVVSPNFNPSNQYAEN